MNWDQISHNWNAVSRTIMLTWGKLSEADLAAISGQREALVSAVQQRYALSLSVAETRVDDFARTLKS